MIIQFNKVINDLINEWSVNFNMDLERTRNNEYNVTVKVGINYIGFNVTTKGINITVYDYNGPLYERHHEVTHKLLVKEVVNTVLTKIWSENKMKYTI